jgi:hypothetical protein
MEALTSSWMSLEHHGNDFLQKYSRLGISSYRGVLSLRFALAARISIANNRQSRLCCFGCNVWNYDLNDFLIGYDKGLAQYAEYLTSGHSSVTRTRVAFRVLGAMSGTMI